MPEALQVIESGGLPIHIYETPEQMGAASADSLVAKQIALAGKQESVGFLIMAAPSAFGFYRAYLDMAKASPDLQHALARTHFFQFDDYPLPADHPATFRYLLNKRFFDELTQWCPRENIHPFNVDAGDPDAICADYTEHVLERGLDIQLKGVGENGHWGFHEPGVPIEDAPRYMEVELSEENAVQQLRDHPDLFASVEDVPRAAYTANVALFLKTKHLIEDNIPQAAKGFAILAAYGNYVVHDIVPTSALKQHPNAQVRITRAAAGELLAYREHGRVTQDALDRMAAALGGEGARDYVESVLSTMELL